MGAVDIHETETCLIERAAAGKPVVIAEAGCPLANAAPIDAPGPGAKRRLGFLAGEAAVPVDFDVMGGEAIEPQAAVAT